MPGIDGANRIIGSLVDLSVRDLIDRDLTTEVAVVLEDKLGPLRPPIANVDGQSVVGSFAGREPTLPSKYTLLPLGTAKDYEIKSGLDHPNTVPGEHLNQPCL